MEKTPNIPFKSEELQLLLAFINANSPLPLQSVRETLRLLHQHADAACREISENLASLHDSEMTIYYDWADEELYKINVYGYHILIMSHSDDKLLKRLGNSPRPDTEECQIGKIVTEGMSPEERNQRFDFSLRITQRYLDKINEVGQHLEDQYHLARKVELLNQKEEDYISEVLERKHQNLYIKVLAVLEIPHDELPEETLRKLPFYMEQLYENQKAEINNNFYHYPAEITCPYLVQMHQLFSQHLHQAIIKESLSPARDPFKPRFLAQLEALCEQLRQLQERQAASPYHVNLSDLLPKNEPFIRFLLMKDTKMLEALQETPALAEADITDSLTLFLDLSESQLAEYLEIVQRPSSTWTGLQQQQLKLVKEYLERLSSLEEYNYASQRE